jgi:hypothetical protein
VVRPPYVIGGDASEVELERYDRQKIDPAARAMTDRYAWPRPREPVLVVLLGDLDTYRRLSEKLSGRKSGSSSGYYQDHLRMAVVNTARGDAGLYHELTHALLAFDCPGAPPWLSEGLATLHETARADSGGVDLTGRDNVRLTILQESIRRGELGPLESLLQQRDFHDRQERLHYAYARYFCLYLEEKGVLQQCYARLRRGIDADPSGSQAVAAVLPGRTWDQLNAEFRAWALARTAPEPATE